MKRYFAVGSADALVSLWDLKEFVSIRTFGNLEWPVRTLSFSYDGQFIASASEDLAIDIVPQSLQFSILLLLMQYVFFVVK